jgi:hypothetical protein
MLYSFTSTLLLPQNLHQPRRYQHDYPGTEINYARQQRSTTDSCWMTLRENQNDDPARWLCYWIGLRFHLVFGMFVDTVDQRRECNITREDTFSIDPKIDDEPIMRPIDKSTVTVNTTKPKVTTTGSEHEILFD